MREKNSKGEILKSTAVFGSAQVIIILVGMVRTKILAVLLGPLGIGISGLYLSTIELIKTATGFGLGYSAVREIAAASASGNPKRVSEVIQILQKWAWATGLFGLTITIIFSRQLSKFAFDNTTHAFDISILSITLLIASLAAANGAVLQGLRRITHMAKATVWTTITGLIITAVIYYRWGINGIVPAIVLLSILELTAVWLYSRKIKTQPVSISIVKTFAKGKTMIKLGFFMTVSLLANTVTMYAVRSFIVEQDGLSAAGFFIAAWTVSSLYISAIFNAMGADYFPRLSAVENDKRAVKKIVNDQTEIALLLTAPIIIGMISFISWIIPLFYSKAFTTTAFILNWQLAGDFFKVLSWPLGFILLAKGKGLYYMITEVVWNVLFLGAVFFGWSFIGIEITGIGFLAAYFLYFFILYAMAVRLIEFQWTTNVITSVCLFLPLIILAFLSANYWQGSAKYLSGFLLTAIATIYSYVHLQKLVTIKSIGIKLRLRKIL